MTLYNHPYCTFSRYYFLCTNTLHLAALLRAQVRIGVHHHSRRKVAIKIVDKSRLTDPNEAKRMQREIRVMRHLSHECVIKLFEV